jgi:outer membrane protein
VKKTYRHAELILVICFFMLLFPVAIQADPVRRISEQKALTLDECIALALDRASGIKKAEYNLGLTGEEILKNYGQFLPKISVNASYTPVSESTTFLPEGSSAATTSSERIDIGVSASLNLFNGFADYAALKSSINRMHSAELTLSRARQTVAFDITQAYYRILLDRELLSVAEKNLEASESLLQLSRRQFETGLKPLTDVLQQEAETANSRLAVIQAEEELRQSRIELQKRMQTDPLSDIDIQTIPPEQLKGLVPSVSADSLIAAALQNRADIESAALESKAAKWDITRSSSARWPSFDVSLSYGTNAYPYYDGRVAGRDIPPLDDQLTDQTNYSVTLSMNWPMFDGFLTRYGVEQSKTAYLTRKLDQSDLERSVILDIKLAAGNYNTAYRQISAAEKNLVAAEKAFETVKRTYELGAATFVEVNSARAAFAAARSEYKRALYNLALQQAVLEYTTGTHPIQSNLEYPDYK